MLQAIRSKASSFIIKVLFAVLIVSFGVWGIGDIFRNGSTDTTIASVGGKDITADQVNQAVQADLQRLRGVLGSSIDLAQAKQFGIVDSALQRLINSDLIDLEISRLGLAVGDAAVRQAILANPSFHGPNGSFDRALYGQLLAANQMTEPQFEAATRHDLVRDQLVGAIEAGVTAPPVLVDTLYRARAERRIADIVTLPPSAVPAPPAPTEGQLAAFHDAHQDAFRAPETRDVKLATLRIDDLAAGIKIPEDKLKDAYQARQGEFHTPEQRQLEQMLLPDESKAKAAKAALDAGQDFAAVAKAQTGADAATTELGWVKRDDLPASLADTAFALKEGGTSDPVQSSFGWHILRLTGIKPEITEPFDTVKAKLAQEMARDQAGDEISRTANAIDDALAGGASFADVAQKFGMKTESLTGIDAQGQSADGKEVALPQPRDPILHAAFATDRGQTSQLTELGEDGYFLVEVDKVVPAAVKPLAETHDQAVNLWQQDQRATGLTQLADSIAKEVEGGKSLKDIAQSRKLTLTTTPPLERTGGSTAIPPALVAKLFGAKSGEVVSAAAGDNMIIAQLASVQPADPAQDKAAVAQLSGQLGTAMQSDMLDAFDQALRAKFPVDVKQANLDRLL